MTAHITPHSTRSAIQVPAGTTTGRPPGSSLNHRSREPGLVSRQHDQMARCQGHELVILTELSGQKIDPAFGTQFLESDTEVVGFSASGTVDRTEFGMMFGVGGLGSEVQVNFEVEAN